MKKLIAILSLTFILFFSGEVTAQDINWSELSSSENPGFFPFILSDDANFFYIFKLENKSAYIEKYKKSNFDRIYSTKVYEYSNNYFNSKGVLSDYWHIEDIAEYVKFVANRFILLMDEFDKTSHETIIYASIYDANTGEQKEEKHEIYRSKYGGRFNYKVSENKEFLHISNTSYDVGNKSFVTSNTVLNKELKILIEKIETAKPKKGTYKTFNHIIDNEGSMYFIRQIDETENYIVSYNVHKDYEKWEERIEIEGLKPKEKLTHVTFSINSKNDLNISGFYSVKGLAWENLKGCFFMRVDGKSKEIVATKVNLFTQEFNNSFLSDTEIKRGRKAEILSEYNYIKVLNKTDGGVYFIAENSTQNISGQYFFYGDLIILNIDKHGNLLWDKRIFKSQIYNYSILNDIRNKDNQQYYSYFAGLDKDKLCIFVNDKEDNLNRGITAYQKVINIEKSKLAIHELSINDGNDKTEMELSKDNFHIKPITCYQSKQGSDIILFAKKGKEYKFGILNFK